LQIFAATLDSLVFVGINRRKQAHLLQGALRERQTRREAGAQSQGPLREGGLVTEQRESFPKLSSSKGGRERVLIPRVAIAALFSP
jgi:hypothetical protein